MILLNFKKFYVFGIRFVKGKYLVSFNFNNLKVIFR